MAYYGVNSGPAEWAQFQQGRRDDQIRDILNMMMAFKRMQTEQGVQDREWNNTLSQQAWQRGMEERRTAAAERSTESLANQRGEEPEKLQMARIYAGLPDGHPLKTILGEVLGGAQTGRRSADEEVDIYRRKSEIDARTKGAPKSIADQDKEYRAEVAKIEANFANKSWALNTDLAKQEATIAGGVSFDKDASLAAIREKYDALRSQAEADKEREINELDIQFPDLPRVQAKQRRAARHAENEAMIRGMGNDQVAAIRQAGLEANGKPDKYNFVLGQKRQAKDGSVWEYVGDNKWRPLKK